MQYQTMNLPSDLVSSSFLVTPQHDARTRHLRGGSGGGGGGGSFQGTGGDNSNGGGSSEGAFGVFAIFGVCLSVLVCLVVVLYKVRKSCRGQPDFEGAVDKAKVAVEQASTAILSYERTTPHSGDYATEYMDRGTQRNGTITIAFTDNGTDGYTLSGSGLDNDGSTEIEDGHANYDGTAWWREKNVTGDVGMQVLSTGKFDFATGSFQGEWHSSTNVDGTYTSFCAKNPPESIATTSTDDDEGVDNVVGVDFAPSVSAAPSKY